MLHCADPGPGADPPNVILISLDTTRADHLSCYGYDEFTSPNLDRFAQSGVLFSNAIAQAAVTPVSHASILTGLNPFSHGLRVLHGVQENRLRDSVVTLAEMLREAGYRTAAFVSAFPAGERFGLDQGFEVFDADFLRSPVEEIVNAQGIVNTGLNQRRADVTTKRALAWLAQTTTPYFVWVHYFDPHDPALLPHREFMARHPPVRGTIRERLRSLYDREIAYMDEQIGRLLGELERRGEDQRTVVIVVADHGEGLGDHDWWTHGILYQEQIRVPLIIRAPGWPPGREVSHLVRTIDIVPTVIELTGHSGNGISDLAGESLVPLLSEDSEDPEFVAYTDSVNMLTYNVHPQIRDSKDGMLFAVVKAGWKYIHHLPREEESELYFLKEDPMELENLYSTHSADRQRMREILFGYDFLPRRQAGTERMSPEDIERLRSLGYVQ